MRQGRILRFLAVAVLGILLAAGQAIAKPFEVVDISGLGNVRITPTLVDFAPLGLGTGSVVVTGTSGADFNTIPGGTPGTITDVPTLPVPPFFIGPVSPFLQVPTPGARFVWDLQTVIGSAAAPCVGGEAVGASCAAGALTLTQNASSVTAGLEVRGQVTDLVDHVVLSYNGLFTANLTAPDQNSIAEILGKFFTGGFVESSWSAELTSQIPEPGSMILMGLGLGVMGIGRTITRRKRDRD